MCVCVCVCACAHASTPTATDDGALQPSLVLSIFGVVFFRVSQGQQFRLEGVGQVELQDQNCYDQFL